MSSTYKLGSRGTRRWLATGLDRLARIMIGLVVAIVAFMLLVAITGGPWAFSSGIVISALTFALGLPGAVVGAFALATRDNTQSRRLAWGITAALCARSVGILAWTLVLMNDQGPYPIDTSPLVVLMAIIGGIGGLIGEHLATVRPDA